MTGTPKNIPIEPPIVVKPRAVPLFSGGANFPTAPRITVKPNPDRPEPIIIPPSNNSCGDAEFDNIKMPPA